MKLSEGQKKKGLVIGRSIKIGFKNQGIKFLQS